ncbi:hypothetical protein NPIL_558071, partial [Nephila pilipes]
SLSMPTINNTNDTCSNLIRTFPIKHETGTFQRSLAHPKGVSRSDRPSTPSLGQPQTISFNVPGSALRGFERLE